MKRRSDINLFEMLKQPLQARSDGRSVTEEHLYGDRNRPRTATTEPPPVPNREILAGFPERATSDRAKSQVDAEEQRTTSPVAEEATDVGENAWNELDFAEEEVAHAPARHWTAWGNTILSIRRVTLVVVGACWLATLVVAFSAGRAGGTPYLDERAQIDEVTDSPAWAPIPRRLAKEPVREVRADSTLNESGPTSTEPKTVDTGAARTSAGLPMPIRSGNYLVQISEARGADRGPKYDPLLSFLDENLRHAGGPAWAVDLRYRPRGEVWRVVLGDFETKEDAEAWARLVRKLPKAYGQSFDQTLVLPVDPDFRTDSRP